MTRRILRSMFANGLFDHPPIKRAYDAEMHAALAQQAAETGIVLLKNRAQLLPLPATARSVAVIGGQADLGVMSGGGTSQVLPPAASGPIRFRVSGEGLLAPYRIATLHPSSPIASIRAAAPGARVVYDNGMHPESAARLAAGSDIAIVFATQWMVEAYDAPSLSLPNGQDQLIEAVAAANPNTIVVLETGGAVLMPWLPRVGAVLEAWYPGIRGGQAIANILFGKTNPSGRLPITFPAAESQLPNPEVPGIDLPEGSAITVDYNKEGSDVGYRWYARHGHTPLFPFGFGLSYTRFGYSGLQLRGGDTITISFDITNRGQRGGADVPQAYLTSQAGKPLLRLIGFSRVELAPGETRRVTLTVDPRLLANYDVASNGWHVPAGEYRAAVGASAADRGLEGSVRLRERRLKP
jgi:beta-glucosidase